jgi:hypothetical protein
MSRIAARSNAQLIDQPIMTNVIADLALETEAAAWLAFRFVAALDRERASESERLLGRIGAPIAKYWNCKRVTAVVAEALECHGGNGFIEDHVMARLYREAPLNGVWEGTGNVIASTCCARCSVFPIVCRRSSMSCGSQRAAMIATTPRSTRWRAILSAVWRVMKDRRADLSSASQC